MVNHFKILLLLSVVLTSCAGRKMLNEPLLEAGVSRSLAVYRKSILSDIHYQLKLAIPSERKQAIEAEETLSFQLSSVHYGL